MQDEKLLPEGEAGIEVTALPVLRGADASPKGVINESVLMPPGMPSAKAQSWGTVISIVVIVLMIVLGAFYAWGKRIAQNQVFTVPTDTTQ